MLPLYVTNANFVGFLVIILTGAGEIKHLELENLSTTTRLDKTTELWRNFSAQD